MSEDFIHFRQGWSLVLEEHKKLCMLCNSIDFFQGESAAKNHFIELVRISLK